MRYKFEKLEVWKLAKEFSELSYQLSECLPDKEKYNLNSQLRRASTSIALNIAEGSTGQTDKEQARFLSYAIRSHIEVIACIRLMENKNYLSDKNSILKQFESVGSILFKKLNAFKNALK